MNTLNQFILFTISYFVKKCLFFFYFILFETNIRLELYITTFPHCFSLASDRLLTVEFESIIQNAKVNYLKKINIRLKSRQCSFNLYESKIKTQVSTT